MRCEKCGGSWVPPKGISKFLDNCPFCGSRILNVEKAKKMVSLSDFLQYLVSIYGSTIYNEKYRLYNFIADLYACDEKMKRVYRRAILEDSLSLKIYNLLLVKGKYRIREQFNQIVSQYVEMNFYNKEFCLQIIYAFIHGLNLHIKYHRLLEEKKLAVQYKYQYYGKAQYNLAKTFCLTAQIIERLIYTEIKNNYCCMIENNILDEYLCEAKNLYLRAQRLFQNSIDTNREKSLLGIRMCHKNIQRLNRFLLYK